MIRCATLVSYWRSVLQRLGNVFEDLEVAECAVGFNLGTLPAGRPYPVGFDFDDLPTPRRSGPSHTPAPWRGPLLRTPARAITDDGLIGPTLDHLLRHFSYRHTAPTIAAAVRQTAPQWSVNVAGASSEQQEEIGGPGAALRPSEAEVDRWVSRAITELGFTDIKGARAALKQDVIGPWDNPDFAWSVRGGVLARGAYSLTQLEAGANEEEEQDRYQAAVADGRRELRRDAFELAPTTAGQDAFVRVENTGRRTILRGEIAQISGVRESFAIPLKLRWSGTDTGDIELGQGEAGLLHLATGSLVNQVSRTKPSPVEWTLHGVGDEVVVHSADVKRSEDIFDREITVTVRVRRSDTDRTADLQLRLSLERHRPDERGVLDVRTAGPFPVRAVVVGKDSQV